MSPPARILLLGMMGAGKSTIGELLSVRQGWPHVDNDQALEDLSGLSREELEDLPVTTLHALEAEHARRLCEMVPPVIAGVAASIADSPDVMALLADAGFCVYLAQSPESVLSRVGRTGVGRQVLRQGGSAAAALSEQFSRRDPVFRSHAALVLDAGRPPQENVDRIVDAWTTWSA